MEHLIRFRHSIDELNHVEFHRFIDTFGKENIVDIIFNHFSFSLKSNLSLSTLDQVNAVITGIIHDRLNNNDAENTKQNSESAPICIEYLPAVLISEISSYLKLTQLIKFERCSRTIFIHSRSPLSLQMMGWSTFYNCMVFANRNDCTYHCHRLQSLKVLYIDAALCVSDDDDESFYNWFHLPLFQNLHTLCIDYSGTDTDDAQDELDNFLHQLKQCSFTNVKSLKFGNYNEDSDVYINSDFLDDLVSTVNKNSNLEYLTLEWILSSDYHILFSNYDWVSQLKGIAVDIMDEQNATEMLRNVYPVMGDEFITFHKGNGAFTEDINGKTRNLKELCIPWHLTKAEIDILLNENWNNLQRVHFSSCTSFVNKEMHHVKMKLFLQQVIESTQYICISGHCMDSLCILQTIDALNDIFKNIKKRTFFIRLISMNCSVFDIDKWINSLVTLTATLSTNCDHFKLESGGVQRGGGIHKMDKMLKKTFNEYYVKSEIEKLAVSSTTWRYGFAVSDTDYFTAYNDKWIMCCSHCKDENDIFEYNSKEQHARVNECCASNFMF